LPHPDTVGVATRQEGGPGWGAGGRTGVEVSQLHPFLRHAVEVGRQVIRAERYDVTVARVGDEYQHDVGLLFCPENGEQAEEAEQWVKLIEFKEKESLGNNAVNLPKICLADLKGRSGRL
jgi:hypothetical protein